MKRISMILLLLVAMVSNSMAIPALRQKVTVTQPDDNPMAPQ